MKNLDVARLLVPAVFLICAAAQNAPAPSSQELMQRAQAGDAGAQAELGRAYQDGNGVPQSDELAAEWYRKSAEQGNAGAQNSLGVMYSLGQGVTQDKAEAVRWYKKAAKQGLAQGAYNVAISYYNGEGMPGDMDLAYAWMVVANARGDPQASEELKRIGAELHGRLDASQFKLAALYEKGEEVSQDPAAAAVLYREVGSLDYRQSAYAGTAQYKLCQLYASGRGVAEDLPQAKSWCKRAVKNGELIAYVVLGRMAEQGIGGEKDLKEAADWYRDAALYGITEGFLQLGRLKSQSSSHEDQKEAYFWFYAGQKLFWKIPAFDAPLRQAAAQLNDKEISDQQKKAAAWLRMSSHERALQVKTH